jgi:tRNA nucleotidyltransferase (CCA-adding enzyme)
MMKPGLESLISQELREALEKTPVLQRAYLVGGWVRDALRGHPGKDVDIEVFGVSYEKLADALARWGRTDLVGRSFGVVKLTMLSGVTYDFTIPRKDSKVSAGHKGFEITFDADITLEEAASRRDFTINSLLFDPRTGELLDFFGGREDLQRGILRHTSAAFAEDPLRVLRGMQFCARFDLEAAPETIQLCHRIQPGYRELAVERVREEWVKWAAKSVTPSRGLKFLAQTGWIEHFPEVRDLRGTPQDPEWHPEGDVFTHTCHCLDALVKLPAWTAADDERRAIYSFAVLAHDFAKPATTHSAMKDGQPHIVSPGHEEAGGPLADQFLIRIGVPVAVRERIVPLVANHLAHLQTVTDRSVRRLAKRLEPASIEDLLVVITADQFGRPPKPQNLSAEFLALRAKAEELRVQSSAPKPILMGRHLIELGLQPGPDFGAIIESAYEAQLEGEFGNLDEALSWLGSQPSSAVSLDAIEKLRARLACPTPGDGLD